ncbi:MAG: MFS transporter [Victivallaceae bacterium]|nr:MFS transporter [Victivallaceae bacterium]
MLQHRNNAFQLGLLTAIHFMVDMLTGTLPGILPLLMTKYGFSIGEGAMLLTLMSLSSNAVQMWAGTLRKRSHRPLLIPLGLALTGLIGLIGLIPVGGGSVGLLVALVLAVGVGTALVHPEGLRAVCAVSPNEVEARTATPVFMTAGFFGFASGAFISGALAQMAGGLYAMLFLLAPVLLLLWLFMRSHVVISADGEATGRKLAAAAGPQIGFWSVFWISVCINTGCSVMQGLLPTMLNDGGNGHSLAFSGFSAMLFGAGAGVGALFTGSVLCRRFSISRILPVEMAVGLPLLCVYLAGCRGDGAWWLMLPLAGGLLGSGFPQLVVMARTARTSRPMAIGVRMGIMVGGSWAAAGILLLAVGQIADLIKLERAIWLVVVCFAPVIPAMIMLNKKEGRSI